MGSHNFLAYLECLRSYAWSKGHSDPDLSSSDEPEPSWLEPELELKLFQLGSARELFASARTHFFQLENQKIAFFAEQKLELQKLHTKNFSSTVFYEKVGTFDFIKSHLRIHTIKTPLIVQISISTVFSRSQNAYYYKPHVYVKKKPARKLKCPSSARLGSEPL